MTKLIVAFRNFANATKKKQPCKNWINKMTHNSSLTLQACRIMAVVATDNVCGIPHSTAILDTALDELLITRTMCRMIYGQERTIFWQTTKTFRHCIWFPRTSGHINMGGHYWQLQTCKNACERHPPVPQRRPLLAYLSFWSSPACSLHNTRQVSCLPHVIHPNIAC